MLQAFRAWFDRACSASSSQDSSPGALHDGDWSVTGDLRVEANLHDHLSSRNAARRRRCGNLVLSFDGKHDGIYKLDTLAVRHEFTTRSSGYRNVLCGTEPKNVLQSTTSLRSRPALLASPLGCRLHRADVAADDPVGSGGTRRSYNLYLWCGDEPTSSRPPDKSEDTATTLTRNDVHSK